MHFRMLTLTNEEKAVETAKIHSFNKYLVASSVCLAHIWQAGFLPARTCSLVYLETRGRLGGQYMAVGMKRSTLI